MDLLIDTHVLLWTLLDDGRIKPSVRAWLANGENRVYVSLASLWEISTKYAQRRLKLPGGFDFVLQFMEEWRMETLPVTLQHVRAASALPFHHGDPFDRMLVAQANIEHLRLVSADPKVHLYNVDILW